MKPAFHQDATIFGYADGELFAGPIQLLFGKVDHDAPATGGSTPGSSVSTSSTRLLGSGWNSMTGTATATLDLFTLLKVDGAWKIMNNVFHQHHEGGTQGG